MMKYVCRTIAAVFILQAITTKQRHRGHEDDKNCQIKESDGTFRLKLESVYRRKAETNGSVGERSVSSSGMIQANGDDD